MEGPRKIVFVALLPDNIAGVSPERCYRYSAPEQIARKLTSLRGNFDNFRTQTSYPVGTRLLSTVEFASTKRCLPVPTTLLMLIALLTLITVEPVQAAHSSRVTTKGKNARPMPDSKFEVLDVQAVTIGEPQRSIKTFVIDKKAPPKKIKCDVLIVGGGVGAVAAASKFSAAHSHLKVCITEETSWLGGQMTSQGVSALDENYLIETSGACQSYQQFRTNIRTLYKQFKLSKIGMAQEYLHPGTSWVTYLAFEPKFALKALDSNLGAAISDGALQVFTRTKVVQVEFASEKPDSANHSIKQVLAVNLESGDLIAFEPRICLDATELGDLLPLAKIPYRVGSDSSSVTGEAHAPAEGDKENVQDFVYPFVVDFKPGTKNTIEKPPHFDEFNDAGKFSFDGYKMFENSVLKDEGNREVLPFWTYRRLIAKENFADPMYPFDVAMINWDSNDLRGYNIIDQTRMVEAERLALAKSLSLGFLYWMQTRAPRDDGGQGYPELELRKDVLGTADGLSKYPYIREARRIIAKKTIVESDVVSAANPHARAKQCEDTVGIGLYPVDIHGRQEVPGAGQQTKPFQIPMSALIPKEGGCILPACKNIGVTHITNGAYRLHPVEWAIGEAQAATAAYCIKHHLSPEKVLSDRKHLLSIQRDLVNGGSPVVWFDDVPTSHPDFAAIQFGALTGVLPITNNGLHFSPDSPIEIFDAVQALNRFLLLREKPHDTTNGAEPEPTFEVALKNVQSHGYFQSLDLGADQVAGRARALSVKEFQDGVDQDKISFTGTEAKEGSPTVTRAEFARWLDASAQGKAGH